MNSKLDRPIRLASIGDSPKVTTGFANVNRMILQGFHNSGIEVYCFGTMDFDYDFGKELPYSFQPTNPFDENGMRTVSLFLVNVQPDVIFILFDPGSASIFVNIIEALQNSGNLRRCPIIVYTPIEGIPIPGTTARFISKVLEMSGEVVLYSPKMVELIEKQFPVYKGMLKWAYHGLDHAPFRKYSDDYRNYLKKLVGWQDYFIVTSVGVNKRTKGFDYIIYTARMLKEMGKSRNIKFYLHTSKDIPTLWGYPLVDMAVNFDVEDMLFFKESLVNEGEGGNIRGLNRITDFMYQPQDNSDEEREKAFQSLGYIDRIAGLSDCYLDLSQVEGWGLPAHEAMRCGIPTISVKDRAIREEIYDGGVLWLESEPFRMWTTWHTGVKLVLVDPYKAAEAIVELKETNDTVRKFWSDCALDNASKYNWAETQEKFNNLVRDIVGKYEYDEEI